MIYVIMSVYLVIVLILMFHDADGSLLLFSISYVGVVGFFARDICSIPLPIPIVIFFGVLSCIGLVIVMILYAILYNSCLYAIITGICFALFIIVDGLTLKTTALRYAESDISEHDTITDKTGNTYNIQLNDNAELNISIN